MNEPIYSFSSLLEEMKQDYTSIQGNQVYETLKPFYSSSKDRHIIIEGNKITKPLAVSKKNKNTFKRDNSPLYEFYLDTHKGDYLKVLEVKDGVGKCINLSLKDEVREKYYKEEYIYISLENVVLGDVKLVQRGAKKLFSKDTIKENLEENK